MKLVSDLFGEFVEVQVPCIGMVQLTPDFFKRVTVVNELLLRSLMVYRSQQLGNRRENNVIINRLESVRTELSPNELQLFVSQI